MTWDSEFGLEYAVPKEILALVADGSVRDVSWHNDASPSFLRELPHRQAIRIWAAHPDPEKRELEGKRYIVSEEANGDGGPDLGETDDVAEAVRIFREAVRRMESPNPSGLAWSRYTGWCQTCRRRFRVSKDVLAEHGTDLTHALGFTCHEDTAAALIACGLEVCMECSGGVRVMGEYINDNQLARRWDPKAWALDTLAAMSGELLRHLDDGARDGDPETAELRLRRRIWIAKQLRARIDNRY